MDGLVSASRWECRQKTLALDDNGARVSIVGSQPETGNQITSSTDVLLMSQANPTSYTVEAVEVMDINSDADTLWVRALEGDNTHRPLSDVPAPILSIADHGDILYLLKSGSYVVDVAWSESEFGLDQNDYGVEAARAEVQAVYRSLLANTEPQPVSIPPAPGYTPRPRPQPTPEPVNVPVRGLW